MSQLTDLNLMKTLVILCEKQGIRRAGIELGITESAVSKQLSRLRKQLDDVLFERVGGRLMPTEYTRSLLPGLKQAMGLIESTLKRSDFTPENYRQAIIVAMPDPFLETFGLPVYESLQQHFPNAPLHMQSWNVKTAQHLISGEVTLGLHCLDENRSAAIYQQTVRRDKIVVAIARCHGSRIWEDVRHWPFIFQHTPGWNDERFHYLEHVKKKGMHINYQHHLDTISFALQLMNKAEVANIIPECTLGDELIKVPGSGAMELDIILTTNLRLTDRTNALHQYLHKLVSEVVGKP
ncbi:MAG: LysR family transcriptional regulator [Endozoicomonas sp.]